MGNTVGGLTADDLTAGGSSSGSSGVDLYQLGPVGSGPIYVTEQQSAMGEHAGGGNTTYVNNPGNVDGNAFARQIAAMSVNDPASFHQWQNMLYAADFYSGKPRPGVYGAADTNALQAALTAYQQVNAQANAALGQGKTPSTPPQAFQAWLNQRIAQVKATGGPGATTKQPLQVQYTDPTAISAALQAGAQQELGRNLNDKELQGFIAQFHGQQKTAQTDAYNGDSSVTPPDLSGQTAQYLISQHGPEHDQKLAAGYLARINQMFGVL